MRSKNMLIAAAALLSASAFTLGMTLKRDLSTIAESGGESVAYVNGEVAASGDGLTADSAVKTLEEGYALVDDGGVIVLCGDLTLTVPSATKNYFMQEKSVIITGSYDGVDYSPVWTLDSDGTKKANVQFTAATVLKYLTVDRGQNLYDNDKCAELWSGPSLTVDEGVRFTNNGGELTAGAQNGQIAVRLGHLTESLDTAYYAQKSGAVSYIQGGNNATDVGVSTIELSGDAEVLDMLQGGGTNKNVESSVITVGENAEVDRLYINGYGSASLGSSTVTIDGGTVNALYATRQDAATTGSITGDVTIEVKNGATVKDFALDGIGIGGKKSLTVSGGSAVYVTGEYTVPVDVLTVNDTSEFILNPCLTDVLPNYQGDGNVLFKHVVKDNPYVGEGDNYTVEVLMSGLQYAMQGTAVYGNYLFTANNRGYCYVYDIPTNTLLGEFWLASGTADGTVATAYLNHANQMMFGAEKFDENDDFPLLYVTTGNSGDHDTDGSYISKCAIERISFDGSTNTWSSELVQTIQFNDAENIPDTDKDGDLLQTFNATDKKFYYVSGNGYDSEKGYQKIGWGWAAAFVDTDPTEVTKDKFYLFCPRYRTTKEYETINKNRYGIGDYYADNAYIVTAFDMPALPVSENDSAYGKTVTLYPKDIVGQFETEYDIYYTQGGTMYQGRIYYSFGHNGKVGDASAPYINGIRVFDIATETIVSRIDLSLDRTVTGIAAKEPECCAFYNGKLVLSSKGIDGESPGHVLYVFDYLEFHVETAATCTSHGTRYCVCAYCGTQVSELEQTPTAPHTMTRHAGVQATCTEDGSLTYYHCSVCGKNFADPDGRTELSDTVIKASHDFIKVEAKAASEDKDGNIEYYLCPDCGKYFADAEGKTELSAAELIVPAKGTTNDDPDTTEGCQSTAAFSAIPLLCASAGFGLIKKRKRKK